MSRVKGDTDCIANKCAMWRWAPNKVTVQKLGAATALTSHGPEKTHGYCGLAGRPEA